MPEFFGATKAKHKTITIRMFMTPSDGINDPLKGKSFGKNPKDDWAVNQYFEIKSLPVVRIETTIPSRSRSV